MSLKNIKKLIYYYLSLLIIPNNLSATPLACPVCAVAIASGLGLSRTFGVKDGVIGIWAGALLLAISQGCVTFLRKKNIKNIFLDLLIYALTYCLIIPMYIGEKAPIVFNLETIFGIDKFLFSIIIGSITLFISSKSYYYMKEKNGKPHFPYEKVALPIVSLLLVSILLNFIL